jgi:hypothetical protein
VNRWTVLASLSCGAMLDATSVAWWLGTARRDDRIAAASYLVALRRCGFVRVAQRYDARYGRGPLRRGCTAMYRITKAGAREHSRRNPEALVITPAGRRELARREAASR